MSEKPRDDLHYFKWEVSDAKALQQLLETGVITRANVGDLFLAVMSYVDKIEIEVSPELKALFATYKVRVDKNREARVKVGESRVEPGRLGGQAKAENAKKRAAAAFKAPTLKQFRDTIKHYLDTEDIEEAVDYDVDAFFDHLKEAGWKIGEEPIIQRGDWETAILARFGSAPQPFSHQQYYSVFETVFSTLHAQRDDEGRSQADDIAYNFFDTYDESTKMWDINGEKIKDVRAALAQFLKQYTENIPP